MFKKIIFSLILIFSFANADLSDFMRDFKNNILNSGSSSEGKDIYNATNRHFITGGSFRYSIPNRNMNLVNINPPDVSLGCGGISITLGAVSSLNFDYLVDKLQTFIKLAPLVAINLVISNLSEKLASVTSYAEEISDIINMLNMDTCSLAKASVGYVVKQTGLIADHEVRTSLAYSDHFQYLKKIQDSANDLKNDLEKYVQNVGGAVRDASGLYSCLAIGDSDKRKDCISRLTGEMLFMEKGIIAYSLALSKEYNTSPFSDFEHVIRAYVGDLIFDPTQNKIDYVRPVCKMKIPNVIQFDKVMESFVTSKLVYSPGDFISIATQNREGRCGKISLWDLYNDYRGIFRGLYNRIKTGQPLTTEQYKLLSIIDIPVAYYYKSLARLEYLDSSYSYLSTDFIDRLSYYFLLKTVFLSIKRLSAQVLASVNKLISVSSQSEAYESYKDLLFAYRKDLEDFVRSVSYVYSKIDEKNKDIYSEFFKKVQEADEKFIKYLRNHYLKSSYYYGR